MLDFKGKCKWDIDTKIYMTCFILKFQASRICQSAGYSFCGYSNGKRCHYWYTSFFLKLLLLNRLLSICVLQFNVGIICWRRWIFLDTSSLQHKGVQTMWDSMNLVRVTYCPKTFCGLCIRFTQLGKPHNNQPCEGGPLFRAIWPWSECQKDWTQVNGRSNHILRHCLTAPSLHSDTAQRLLVIT